MVTAGLTDVLKDRLHGKIAKQSKQNRNKI